MAKSMRRSAQAKNLSIGKGNTEQAKRFNPDTKIASLNKVPGTGGGALHSGIMDPAMQAVVGKLKRDGLDSINYRKGTSANISDRH